MYSWPVIYYKAKVKSKLLLNIHECRCAESITHLFKLAKCQSDLVNNSNTLLITSLNKCKYNKKRSFYGHIPHLHRDWLMAPNIVSSTVCDPVHPFSIHALSCPFPPTGSTPSLVFLFLSCLPLHTCFSSLGHHHPSTTHVPTISTSFTSRQTQCQSILSPSILHSAFCPSEIPHTSIILCHSHPCPFQSRTLLCICVPSLTSIHHCTPHTSHTLSLSALMALPSSSRSLINLCTFPNTHCTLATDADFTPRPFCISPR